MKRLIAPLFLSFLLFPLDAYAQSNDEYIALKTKYDRFKDETTVEIPMTEVWGTQFDGLRFFASYTQKGSTAIPPEKIIFGFVLVIKDQKPVRSHDLYVIADGQRYELGEVKDLGFTQPMAGWNILGQQFGKTIPPETFLKLAQAKKVEMKIDFIEFEIKPNFQDAMRRLADRAGIKSQTERPLRSSPSSPAPIVPASSEWSFPKPGMAKKRIEGAEFYDLGNEFYALLGYGGSSEVAIVVLPKDIEPLLEQTQKEGLKIASLEQALCAVAVLRAVTLRPGEKLQYVGPIKSGEKVAWLFQTRANRGVGARLSDNRDFVLLMFVPIPD